MSRTEGSSSKPKLIRLAVAVLVVTLIGVPLLIEVIAAKSWTRFERDVAELLEEARREQVPREPLRPPAERGDAWSYYSSALKNPGLTHLRTNLEAFLANDPKVDRSLLQADFADAAPSFADLGLGARCPDVFRRPIHEVPKRRFDSEASLSVVLAQLAVARAKVLVEERRPSEALDLLLDVAQFGRDYVAVFGGSLLRETLLILGEALEGMRDHVVAGAWGVDDLKRLASALEILDRSFPSSEAAAKEQVARMGEWLLVQDPYSSQISLGAELSRTYHRAGWRQGFSMRIYKAAAFERWRNVFRRPVDGRGRRDNLPEDESANDFELAWLDILVREDPTLGCRARLRLLRMAAAFLAGAEVPDLADPFGKRLRAERTPEGLKLWSVGGDGVDDGGRGPWKRRERPNEAVEAPDFVLEVKLGRE